MVTYEDMSVAEGDAPCALIAVGILIAGDPPARIRTCPLRHPAPPLGCADGESLARPRVSDFELGPVCPSEGHEAGQ